MSATSVVSPGPDAIKLFSCSTQLSMKFFQKAITVSATSVVSPGPDAIKLFSCSTQLSMKFFLLINIEMPTNVGILTFMTGKNSILGLSEPK